MGKRQAYEHRAQLHQPYDIGIQETQEKEDKKQLNITSGVCALCPQFTAHSSFIRCLHYCVLLF